MKIVVTSPTRVDLAGGTIDCWPLFLLLPQRQCVTVNLSIDVMTQVELEPRVDQEIHLNIVDLRYQRIFSGLSELLSCADNEVLLVKEHVAYWQPEGGFSLKTQSQSPVGGGLGGSSSLSVSLLKAFRQWLKADLTTPELVNIAHNIEARVLRTPTGTQDYFPAAEAGLHVIEYSANGPQSRLIKCDAEVFADQMLLVYTGVPHHSGINNWQVIQSAVNGDSNTLNSLAEVAEISSEVAKVCEQGHWDQLAGLFEREYHARIGLSAGFSSPEIKRLRELVLQAGAKAVKICGAGGGGCVMVWSAPAQREEVLQACQTNGYQVLNAKPVVNQTP